MVRKKCHKAQGLSGSAPQHFPCMFNYMLGVQEYERNILHLHFKLLTLKWIQVQKFDISKMTLSLLKSSLVRAWLYPGFSSNVHLSSVA